MCPGCDRCALLVQSRMLLETQSDGEVQKSSSWQARFSALQTFISSETCFKQGGIMVRKGEGGETLLNFKMQCSC